MIYLFGKMVTAEEKIFFSDILAKKPDRIAQGKYFKAVCNTARREGVSLIEAHDILELNKTKVKTLNEKVRRSNYYYVDSQGEISKNLKNFFNDHIFKRKVSKSELEEIENGVTVNPTEPKPTFFSDAKRHFKKAWGLIKEAFTVY